MSKQVSGQPSNPYMVNYRPSQERRVYQNQSSGLKYDAKKITKAISPIHTPTRTPEKAERQILKTPEPKVITPTQKSDSKILTPNTGINGYLREGRQRAAPSYDRNTFGQNQSQLQSQPSNYSKHDLSRENEGGFGLKSSEVKSKFKRYGKYSKYSRDKAIHSTGVENSSIEEYRLVEAKPQQQNIKDGTETEKKNYSVNIQSQRKFVVSTEDRKQTIPEM